MKVFIADDNLAVQEIIRNIFAERGHNVRTVSTVDEAVEKIKSFEPDVVILDSWVYNADSMHVLSRTKEELLKFDLKMILIKLSGELAPAENLEIKGQVDNPFKSSNILDALERLNLSEAERKKSKRRVKKKRQGLLHRKRAGKAKPPQALSESGIVFGLSYVMFDPESEKVYKFVSSFDTSEYSVLIVSSDMAKTVNERFSCVFVEVVQLISSRRAGTIDIQGLGSLMIHISQFIEETSKPVFDTSGEIIEANEINTSLLMLKQFMARSTGTCTFAVSVDTAPLTDKDCGILPHDMTIYNRS